MRGAVTQKLPVQFGHNLQFAPRYIDTRTSLLLLRFCTVSSQTEHSVRGEYPVERVNYHISPRGQHPPQSDYTSKIVLFPKITHKLRGIGPSRKSGGRAHANSLPRGILIVELASPYTKLEIEVGVHEGADNFRREPFGSRLPLISLSQARASS